MHHQRWLILLALTFARTSMGFQFQSIGATAPLLAPSLGLAMSDIGTLVGLYMLPGVVVALPGGVLGARFGDKRVAVIGIAAMAAGGLLLAMAGDFQTAVAGRLLSGAGGVLMNVTLSKMVADWFAGRELVLAMSIFVNSWPIGIGLALLVLGGIAEAWSPQHAFATTSAFALLGMAAVVLLYRPAPDAAAAPVIDLRAITGREWRMLAVGSAPWMFYNAAYAIFVAFTPVWLTRMGMDVAVAGGFTAFNTALTIASVQVGGILAQRWRRLGPIVACGLLAWGAALLGLSSGNSTLAWLVVGGLFCGLPAGIFVALPAQFLRQDVRGAGMGVFFSVSYAGMGIFPPLAGWAADWTGDASAPLQVAVAVIVATAAAYAATRAMQRAAIDPTSREDEAPGAATRRIEG